MSGRRLKLCFGRIQNIGIVKGAKSKIVRPDKCPMKQVEGKVLPVAAYGDVGLTFW